MHIFSVAVACLLCSSFTAAGPLRRDRTRKFGYRQVASFQNTTTSADSAPATIEVIPVTQATTDSNTATAITTPSTQVSDVFSTESASQLSTSTSTEASTSTLDTTSSSLTSTTAASVAKGANTPGASAFRGTGSLFGTVLVSANSSRPTGALSSSGTQTQVSFVFAETTGSPLFVTVPITDLPPKETNTAIFPFSTLTTASGEDSTFTTLTSTSGEASTFTTATSTPSEVATPTGLPTDTTQSLLAITVSGEGEAIPVTPTFFTTAPLPSSTSPSLTEQTPSATEQAPSTTEQPTSTIDTTTAADTTIISVPTVLTAFPKPSAISASTFAANLASAQRYNDIFLSLTPTSACTANSIACISGKRAICSSSDGQYELSDCARGKACYALPMSGAEGVFVGCADIRRAEEVLGLPDSLSVTIGTVPVVVPTTTSTAVGGGDGGVTSTAPAITAAAVQTGSGSAKGDAPDVADEGSGGDDEETTVLHSTIISTITVSLPAPTPTSTTLDTADTATAAAAAPESLITIVPVAASAGDAGENGDGNGNGGGDAISVVTVTVTEKVTIKEAGVTSTATTTVTVTARG